MLNKLSRKHTNDPNKRKGNGTELTFAKTFGTVTGKRGKILAKTGVSHVTIPELFAKVHSAKSFMFLRPWWLQKIEACAQALSLYGSKLPDTVKFACEMKYSFLSLI